MYLWRGIGNDPLVIITSYVTDLPKLVPLNIYDIQYLSVEYEVDVSLFFGHLGGFISDVYVLWAGGIIPLLPIFANTWYHFQIWKM